MYLKVIRRLDLKSSHDKKNIFVSMDVNWIYVGDHFAIYTNFDSLLCTPET